MNIEEIKKRFYYDPDTGVITRRINGKVMGSLSNKGYICVGFGYKIYKAHRLAWAYVHGYEPEGQIDHINGDKADNRISNLRVASNGENQMNTPIQSNNRSGVKGVCYIEASKKWHAYIYFEKKKIDLGHYSDIEKAASARALAAYMFHGEFNNSGR